MIRTGHIRTDIVLVGGGHAHVHVLKVFAMRPESGVRLTLITRDLETPYSGMLPGVVAGIYLREQAQIDLVRLAAATGARLIHAEAIGLDDDRRIRDHNPLASHPNAIAPVLAVPIDVLHADPVCKRTTQPFFACELVEPGFQGRIGVAAIIPCGYAAWYRHEHAQRHHDESGKFVHH